MCQDETAFPQHTEKLLLLGSMLLLSIWHIYIWKSGSQVFLNTTYIDIGLKYR